MHTSKLHIYIIFRSATNLESTSFEDFSGLSASEMYLLPPKLGFPPQLDMKYSEAIFDQFLNTYGPASYGE